MSNKKRLKFIEENFWSTFYAINVPKHIKGIPEHIEHVRFRLYDHVEDAHLTIMVKDVKSVGMLDLDETYITNEGIKELTKLESIRELRLKGCSEITDEAMPYICAIKGLELLHLIGTNVTENGFAEINKLTQLKKLLIPREIADAVLEEIYVNLPNGCELIVAYKIYPFD